MKSKFWIFKRNSKVLHFVTAVLIVCMAFVDVSEYLSYVYREGDTPEGITVVNEEHEMETYLADGEYTGDNSETQNGSEESVSIPGGRHQFNILEIVPIEKKGIMGYLAAGCEPLFEADDALLNEIKTYGVTEAQMRTAYMDALVNPNPGSSNANDRNFLYNYNDLSKIVYQSFNEAFSDSGSTAPFNFEVEKSYPGVYKYVGSGNGVYAEETPGSKNGIMKSKFYHNSGSFDYIFLEGESATHSKDIAVTSNKRIKYINNDKFIKDCLKKTGADYTSWKGNNVMGVRTRTPRSVTLQDIEAADIIFINNANKKDYYKYALNIYNLTHGISSKDQDNGVHFYSPENDSSVSKADRIDFDDFEKVIRIYERIVVRNDCAMVVEKNCCTTASEENISSINTNIRKLMFMLFYVKKGNKVMMGRDLFADYFKRYTSQPGEEYLRLRELHLQNPRKYPVDYRATTLIKNTSDPTDPSYYFTHAHNSGGNNHVGHPLVLDKTQAITGVQLVMDQHGCILPVLDENGNIVTEHDDSKVYEHVLQRWEPDMFTDAGISSGSEGSNGYYYKDERKGVYCYKYAYESMSNTTDFIYIDNDGKLIVDTKYSSDQTQNPNYRNYWYRIDADGGVDGQYAFRRRKWGQEVYDEEWPWNKRTGELTVWLMHRQKEQSDMPYGQMCYDCNMHMWYDYYQLRSDSEKYTTISELGDGSTAPPFNKSWDNQSLMEENALFKKDWISKALEGRDIKRELTDADHMADTVSKNYYTYLSVQNGDGVNKSGTDSNKILYYNEYEKEKISSGATRIPIKIKLKTSCKLDTIKVYDTSVSNANLIVTYNINTDASNTPIDCNGVSAGGVAANNIVLTPKNEMEGSVPKLKTSAPDNTPIYTYEGYINAKLSDIFLSRRNTKFIIEFNVIAPDGSRPNPPRRDEVTIVRRDFFMLN